MSKTILFIGNKNSEQSKTAAEFLKLHFEKCVIFLGSEDESLPDEIRWWNGDYIISYGTFIPLPQSVLASAKNKCLRFHFGSSEHPFENSINFAIYNREKVFGVTCHSIEATRLLGPIIKEKSFAIFENDTSYSLKRRADTQLLSLFFEVMDSILLERDLPVLGRNWKETKFNNDEFLQMFEINHNMPEEEIERRVKATMSENDKPSVYAKFGEVKLHLSPSNTI